MIRPVTLITAALAVLSGLYLYYSKNAVLMLDRQIERIARDTISVAEQTRLLHAEWTLLNDPERLRQFSDRYLALKPLAPTQFTSLNDLATRLPAPRAPEPDPPPVTIETTGPSADSPTLAANPTPAEEPAPAIVAEEVLPIPPLPVPPPAPASALVAARAVTAAPIVAVQGPAPAQPPLTPARSSEPTPARPPVQAQAARAPETRAPETRAVDTRPVATVRPPLQGPIAAPQPPSVAVAGASQSVLAPTGSAKPAAPVQTAANLPRPTPLAPPQPVSMSGGTGSAGQYGVQARQQSITYQPTPAAYGGSMLGGAPRATSVPLPRPTPTYAPIQDGGG